MKKDIENKINIGYNFVPSSDDIISYKDRVIEIIKIINNTLKYKLRGEEVNAKCKTNGYMVEHTINNYFIFIILSGQPFVYMLPIII